MSALILTSAAGVDDAAVLAVVAAANADIVDRLGLNGVLVAAGAETLEAARAAAAPHQVDVNWIAEARPRRLFLADMDSTIVTVECIDELAAAIGVGEKVALITERAMAGELVFDEALRERVALLEGLDVATLERVAAERAPLSPGAAILVATMNKLGALTALVSGGFTFFTERVAARTGFQHNRANQLEIMDGRLTGRVVEPILGREAKLEALERFAAELGVAPDEAIVVGDGANDLAMVRAAGIGVAYKAKPALVAEADARLDHSDLTALLHLQGVRAAEFAAV